MIDRIRIQNFKSIVNMTIDLGRINVIIGTNGCGKTNILEAITFASAASQNKLDNEFLGTRLRNVPSPFMFSAFEDIEPQKIISISIKEEKEDTYKVAFSDNRWKNLISADMENDISVDEFKEITNEVVQSIINKKSASYIIKKFNVSENFLNALMELLNPVPHSELANFLIYAPEETKLRTFSDDTYILPLGRRGEGLFQHLKQLTENKDEAIIQAINKGLFMLDWFDGFNIPDNLLTNEYKLSIGDRYLSESLHQFDQRSTNEGFLYLLFYLTLFNSKNTPSFFAIDNIETSFNPKLCTKLTEYLVDSAEQNNKQVILTTHSPYVLDGLDLSNDTVRLFVARRDIDGHTRIERIPYRENRTTLLSDLWMSGLIGGLPDNF